MKYLKYIIGIIAALVIIFLLIGFLIPSVSYDKEIMVDKPLEESWNVMQDEEKMADWLEGFQKVEHVSGTPGTVGAEMNVYFLTDGQETIIREKITAVKPYESIEMQFESDFMNMHYELKMTAVEGKTKISSSTKAIGNGMFSRSLMVLMGSSLKNQEETNLTNLKNTIVSNTKEYYASELEATETIEN